MALFELVLKSVYADQQCVNRWNYVGSGTPASISMSAALARAFGAVATGSPAALPTGTMFEALRNQAVNACSFNEVISMNVYDLSDFYTTGFADNITGLRSGGGAPPYVAAGWRTNRVTRAVARGTKRLAGVPLDQLQPEGEWGSAYITALEAVATIMSANRTYDDEGNTLTFSPCVVHKLKYTTPSGKFAYKYYPTLSEQMPHVAQGIEWQVYDTARSQTSRQYGNGS